jgi:Fe-S-cluster containining protein
MDEPQDGPEQPWRSALDDVERQVARGSLFTHTALSESAERLTEVETFLYGLVDVLVAKGVVDPAALGDAATAVGEELDQRGDTMAPGVALRVDDGRAPDDVVVVDCAARMHVCHAVCCRLHFPLSAEEVEGGAVRWDLGRPYQIRHDDSGTCVHNDPGTGSCSVYEDRPGVCRTYSCAHDERIWTDFATMTLNTAWIEENLHGTGPRLARASMVRLPDPVLRPGAGPQPASEDR